MKLYHYYHDFQSNLCHSDDRREEESRWHKVDVSEILRFALNDSRGCLMGLLLLLFAFPLQAQQPIKLDLKRTIELANDRGASGDWHVSDKTIETAITLIADICKRNGINKLNYTGDLSGNLCMHCWVCSTACPGPYLKKKFSYIAKEVNKILTGDSVPFLVRVTISDLYIRKGAGTNYKAKGFIKPGVYTIVKTKGDWGKLKSGEGWICLKYATKL